MEYEQKIPDFVGTILFKMKYKCFIIIGSRY